MVTKIAFLATLGSLVSLASAGVDLKQYSGRDCKGNLRLCRDIGSRYCCRNSDERYRYTSGSCVGCGYDDDHLI